ncbi:MAG: hypothetical protein GC181_14170 [Bacteroidetes bacterium]|nr:hypothetical protein [Bacteroidota bacterium]
MKLKTAITIAFLFAIVGTSNAQMTFFVSPGIGLNSAAFGYRVNDKLIPFIGLQMIGGNASYSESGERYDTDRGQVVDYNDESKYSLNFLMPTLGAKYFLMKKEKISSYGILSISKPIVTGKGETNGEADNEYKDALKNIKAMGLQIGYGCEYFFDEHFSIGGEFGLQFAHVNVTDMYDMDFYNPNTNQTVTTTITETYKVNLRPTYTRFTLNFYL